MDADDQLSRLFLDFCASSLPRPERCAISRGLIWVKGSPHVTRLHNIHHLCGSSLTSCFNSLPEMSDGHWLLRRRHIVTIDDLTARGDSIVSLDSPESIYRAAMGVNLTDIGCSDMRSSQRVRIKLWLACRPFTPGMRHEFGLA